MHGLDRMIGRQVDGIDHLRQSLFDILTTRVGTRVMQRLYGSDANELIDAPLNRPTVVEVFAEVAGAIDLWEPRLELTEIQVDAAEAGALQLSLKGNWFYNWPALDQKFIEVAL